MTKKFKSIEGQQQQRLAYTISETAELLGVSYHSVFRLIHTGKLRSIKIIGKHLIPVAELHRILDQ